MPRILRILNRLNLGGPTYNAAYLTKYVAAPFETRLVAGKPENHEAGSDHILESMGLEADRIPSLGRAINLPSDLKAFLALRGLIREYRPDIVHTHASKAGALGRLAAKAERVPVIVHTFHGHWFHSYFSPLKTRLLLNVERRLSRISTCIIAISERQASDISEVYRVAPNYKVRIVPLGIDIERFRDPAPALRSDFRRQFHIPEDHVLLAHIGRLVPVKNQALLLRVLAEVLKHTQVPVSVCIVGDGPEREALMSLARKLQIPYRLGREEGAQPLVFTSWLKDIEKVHAAADMGILTSRNEGTPLSLIESQASGRPVLSTDVGGVRDALIPNQTGFLSPAGDVESMAKHALRLIEDRELRRTMGEKGSVFAAERFSYRRMVRDMTRVYNDFWTAHLEGKS